MGTTWPVITEVTHLLDFSVGKQLEFLEWVERGGTAVADIETKDLAQIAGLRRGKFERSRSGRVDCEDRC